MKKIAIFSVLFSCFIVLLPLSVSADGGIMPPPDYWVTETDQKAVIVFENNTETLILSTSFEGSAKDFAWIIPTPSKPEVNKGPVNIFDKLRDLTEVYDNRGGIIYSQPTLGIAEKAEPTVNVIEQKKIGIYNISVLEANDTNALYNWLKNNNYNYPEYGKVVLDDYIRNSWYFTAVKINPENISSAENDLNRGTITPLKLVFPSDKIVFPLKISSVIMDESNIKPLRNTTNSANTGSKTSIKPVYPHSQYVSILLYVFADHKKQADDFNTQYADWVDTKTIKKLDFDENGNPWYSPKSDEMYLTKLYRNMNTTDMKSDIFLTNADDNSTVPPSQFWYNFFLTIFIILAVLISPFVLLYVVFMLFFIFLKSKVAKTIFLILQGFIILSGVFIAAIGVLILNEDYSGINNGMWPVIISSSIILIAMIVGMILEIILSKRKQLL